MRPAELDRRTATFSVTRICVRCFAPERDASYSERDDLLVRKPLPAGRSVSSQRSRSFLSRPGRVAAVNLARRSPVIACRRTGCSWSTEDFAPRGSSLIPADFVLRGPTTNPFDVSQRGKLSWLTNGGTRSGIPVKKHAVSWPVAQRNGKEHRFFAPSDGIWPPRKPVGLATC